MNKNVIDFEAAKRHEEIRDIALDIYVTSVAENMDLSVSDLDFNLTAAWEAAAQFVDFAENKKRELR